MENILLKYMSGRMHGEQKESSSKKKTGPVITVSRQYGCWGSRLAKLISETLNQRSKELGKENYWEWISKEVLDESAKMLNVNPDDIAHIFGASEKSIIKEIKESFSSKKYITDSKIKKTITDVVRSFAVGGKTVIVGRAGCIIAKDIYKSLHIRFIAPTDWRVERIRQRFNFSLTEAKKQVAEIDQKRDTFMRFYRGDRPDSKIFDIIFNLTKLSDEEILETILNISEKRGFIE